MSDRLRPFRIGETPRLIVLAAIVGVGAGLGAVVLIGAIELVSTVAGSATGVEALGPVWPFVILPAGIWLSWRLTSWFAPEVAGHGVPQIIAAIALRGGRVRARVMGLKTVTTALTIGVGGSVGREGSVAQIGSSIGAWVARVTRLPEHDVRVLVAAGAGAGISATFNAPIAGMFFAMEVILQEFALRHVHMIVIASVAGAVVSRSVIGEDLTFQISGHALVDPRQLVLYAVLGLVSAAAAWLFLTLLDLFELHPAGLPNWSRPLIFGVSIAAVGWLAPEVLGTGQGFVGEVLNDQINLVWWMFAFLAVAKAVATAMTLGGRGAGGIFMPSLFIGATTGAGTALLLDRVWGFSPVQPGTFALVGMAATFSAVARAPLTSILIVFEITGDYGMVLPLMLATAVSTVLAVRARPESAYTAPLARMGIHPVHAGVTDLLDTISVGEVIPTETPTVTPTTTLAEIETILQRGRLHGIPVVDQDRLVGLVAESDIVRAGGPSEHKTAADAMTSALATVNPETKVSDALERMAALRVGRLPVVDGKDPERLLGVFRRADVIAAYHGALGAVARSHSAPDRMHLRTATGTTFLEMTVAEGSPADGRPVREIPWPEGCLVVSLYRGPTQVIPTGSTVLQSGDTVTILGGAATREPLVQQLTVRQQPDAP